MLSPQPERQQQHHQQWQQQPRPEPREQLSQQQQVHELKDHQQRQFKVTKAMILGPAGGCISLQALVASRFPHLHVSAQARSLQIIARLTAIIITDQGMWDKTGLHIRCCLACAGLRPHVATVTACFKQTCFFTHPQLLLCWATKQSYRDLHFHHVVDHRMPTPVQA